MKMEKIKGMAMAMIPVALGVAAGMLLYDQVKKATAGTSSFSNVGGDPKYWCKENFKWVQKTQPCAAR
jgi:hypothetical protein